MNNVNFIPKTELEEYLERRVNFSIYNELLESDEWKGLFDPLDFLNLLYENYFILRQIKNKPLKVKAHLLSIPLDGIQRYYLLNNLKLLILLDCKSEKEYLQFSICSELLEIELTKLKKKKVLNVKFDFDNVLKHIATLPNDQERIKYLIEIRTSYRQKNKKSNIDSEISFDKQCDLEIEKFKEIFAINSILPANASYNTRKFLRHENLPAPVINQKLVTKKNNIKTFPEYLMHDKSEQLAAGLKNAFKTEQGKGIRLMIEALIQHDPVLLTISHRGNKAFYESLKSFFARDIASYNAVFGCSIDLNLTDKPEYSDTCKRINYILKEIAKHPA